MRSIERSLFRKLDIQTFSSQIRGGITANMNMFCLDTITIYDHQGCIKAKFFTFVGNKPSANLDRLTKILSCSYIGALTFSIALRLDGKKVPKISVFPSQPKITRNNK